jgi:hypothetical protein
MDSANLLEKYYSLVTGSMYIGNKTLEFEVRMYEYSHIYHSQNF